MRDVFRVSENLECTEVDVDGRKYVPIERAEKAESEVERLQEREAFLTERLQLIGNLTSRPVIVEMVRNSVGLKD